MPASHRAPRDALTAGPVARNRKRAKERQRTAAGRARPVDALSAHAGQLDHADELDGAPDPLAHATPDAELAAQLAAGGPEPAEDDEAPDDDGAEDEVLGEEVPEDDELAELADEAASMRPAGSGNGGGGATVVARPGGSEPGRPAARGERVSLLHRFITFLQGSWAELQRVQWPDRRQVMQATGVVIGFVIVAGLYLALSDTISSHLMDWILK